MSPPIFDGDLGGQSMVVATSKRHQINDLIILYPCDRSHCWNHGEMKMVRKVAEETSIIMANADIYQQLQAALEQAEEASRLKNEFLITINDRLRNPLNNIILSLKLILEDMMEDPQEQREFIHNAHHSAIGLWEMIDDLLTVGKPKAEKIDRDLDSVNLTELLSDVERFMQPSVLHKNLKLTIQKIPTRDEIILYSNYRQLLEVMLNLVGNSVKFTPEGEINISFKIIKKKIIMDNQQLPGMVQIRVDDTGIGVPLAKISRLFQPFGKVDGSTTTTTGGMGLGLVICKQLLEAMGGEINFFSMGEGLGSTVTFTVPLYREPLMI
jgi:signal transduction histidine kinase